MGQQTIRFRIRPDGRVEEAVEGVVGDACLSLTSRIEAQLGQVRHREATAAAYQGVSETAQHSLHQHPAA